MQRFGIIRSFDKALYTASVEITGYQATQLEDVPVAFGLREDLVAAGTRCVVLLNEGFDSSDAVVVALFGGQPSALSGVRAPASVVVASYNGLDHAADFYCDGVDDEVQIQAAIDSLPAKGGTVLLLEGTFIVWTDSIVLKPHTVIAGMGSHSTLVQARATFPANEYVLKTDPGYGALVDNVYLRHLQVNGSYVANCVDLRNVASGSAHDVVFLGFSQYGVNVDWYGSTTPPHPTGAEKPGGMRVYDCRFSGTAASPGVAIYTKWNVQTWIEFNWFSVYLSNCIQVVNTENAFISNNVMLEHTGTGILVEDDGAWYSRGVACTGNKIRSTQAGSNGIIEQNAGDYNVVVGNIVDVDGTAIATVGVSTIVEHNVVV